MFIHNIRTGFATNSSSTHSLVIWADGDTREAEVTSNYFGWDEFVLNSSREKLRYLQAIVRANATFAFGEPAANLIVETLTGPILGESDEMPDHQSHMTIPRDYSGKFFHLPFIQDLKSFLLRENVSVFGGNDNEDGTLHVGPESTQIPTSGFTPATSESTDPDLVAIKDAESGHYTFFNRGTGLRTIWSFDNVKPERSYNPILVDVKITDYCTFGCEECAPPGTFINTKDGTVLIEDVKPGTSVLVFTDDGVGVREVSEVYRREYVGDLIDIIIDEGCSLRLTPNHPVMTSRGWVLAGELTLEDEIVLLT